MNHAAAKIFFLTVLLLQPALGGEEIPENVNLQSATDQEREVDEVRNDILKSLFFKGEVADAIIENNLYGTITKKEFSTYSELRDYLINWISKNPDEAADLYYSAKHKRDVAKMPSELAYFVPFVVINPHFKDLVERLERSANDQSITDEKLRLDGARLFEGYINYGDGWLDIDGTVRPAQGVPSVYSFVNYKINPSALNSESENLKNVYNSLKGELASAGERLALKKESLERKYTGFSVFVSGIKGRKNLSEKEAKNLEALRLEMRRNFISAKLLLLASELRRHLPQLSDGLLKYDLEKFIKMLEQEAAGLDSGEANLALAFNFLKQSQEIYESLKRELVFHQRIAAVKKEAENPSFSCFFDYLNYKALKLFYPKSGYLAARKRVAAALPDINFLFENSENRRIQSLGEAEYKKAREKITGMEKDLAALKKAAKINRKAQFYFWEILWPFGVRRGEEGAKKVFANFFDIMDTKDGK